MRLPPAILLLLLAPSPAFAQSPPAISQVTPEPVTVNQLMAVIAERDRLYHQRFDAQEKSIAIALTSAEKAVQAALTAAKEAVQKAEIASEKRFDSVNEFRNTLKDQQLLLMTRAEGETRFKDMDRRLNDINETLTRRASELKGAGETWAMILAAFGVLSMLIAGYVALNPRRPATAKA